MVTSTQVATSPNGVSRTFVEELAKQYRERFPGVTRGGWDLPGEIDGDSDGGNGDGGGTDNPFDWLTEMMLEYLEEIFTYVPPDFEWTDEIQAAFDQWMIETFGF